MKIFWAVVPDSERCRDECEEYEDGGGGAQAQACLGRQGERG